MMNEIQRRIYDFLLERIQTEGIPPSVREIGAEVGLRSTSSVHANLKALEAEGYISRDPMLKRSIRIEGIARGNFANIPLLGTVTAGLPILAVEQVEEYIPYNGPHGNGKTLFALHVRGDSMVNAAILDGDIVVVEQTPVAENGEIVVALLGEEATVKRFYRERNGVRLQPENPDYEPIFSREVVILGRVISLLRYY